jgi:hypothetical protein
MYLTTLLFSLSWASGSAWEPRYLSGLSLLESYETTAYIGHYKIEYEYLYEDNVVNMPYKKDKIEYLMRKSLEYSIDKINQMSIKFYDCKDDLDIHLIQLTGQTLNKSDRFGSWKRLNGSNLEVIYGLYDPTVDVYRNSIIIFSPINTSDYVIVHEMAHYWYDRFCLYEHSEMQTEYFAKSVENNYKLGTLGK